MQTMWLSLLSCKPFEDTFENAHWGKVKQMQPMWLCLLRSKCTEVTFKKTQRRKAKQMQPVWLCLLWPKIFEEAYEEAQFSVERKKVIVIKTVGDQGRDIDKHKLRFQSISWWEIEINKFVNCSRIIPLLCHYVTAAICLVSLQLHTYM